MLVYQRTGTGTTEQLDEREDGRWRGSGSLCKIEAMWELWGKKPQYSGLTLDSLKRLDLRLK